MEIIKKGRFTTDYYGSVPAVGEEKILQGWIEDKENKWLLSWAEQIADKGKTAIESLETILAIFHRNADGYPIIPNHQLRRCLIVTGQTIFNAMKDRSHPKKDMIPNAITLVEPIQINLYNGALVKTADGVKTYTVSLKKRSFFKAYEFIKAGVTFDAKIYYDDEMLSEDHMSQLLSKAGLFGVGAFRERFGKFEWI